MRLLIFIILITFFSCQNKKEKGLKFVIQCKIPENFRYEFSDEDFLKVDWKNQIYFFKDSINKIDEVKFNNRICFGACMLKAFLNGKERYQAVLDCDMGPNNLSTWGRNAIYIKAGDETLNLFYENKLQLDLNSKRILTSDPDKQKKLSLFLYDKDIKKYLLEKSLIKE